MDIKGFRACIGRLRVRIIRAGTDVGSRECKETNL